MAGAGSAPVVAAHFRGSFPCWWDARAALGTVDDFVAYVTLSVVESASKSGWSITEGIMSGISSTG